MNILGGVAGAQARACKSRYDRFNGCLTVMGIPGLTHPRTKDVGCDVL